MIYRDTSHVTYCIALYDMDRAVLDGFTVFRLVLLSVKILTFAHMSCKIPNPHSVSLYFSNIDLKRKITVVEWFSVPRKFCDCKVVEFCLRIIKNERMKSISTCGSLLVYYVRR